ncbi:IclR family transcriptional regulator [Xenophilus arseniciresistens]|uniref:IclR family transcriptional regulator n=1 Tax=Xenophilus arseniciresistens TaxID=1283306 RepID=A0AAE3SZL4_9BURK|nr:IclR family transcriptional regulator [Xenophilus arseniciresistens]MDA7415357.1 IclR family transcriptional regulator [Xenophilus arseniciresistens]
MSGALEKSLAILEHLIDHPDGAALVQIATDLKQLRSGCHRSLQELIRLGYVRQLPTRGDYALTTKMASMGMRFISKSGVVDLSQPVINRLAQSTEELVRLAIVDGERLTLVAKAQGARSGLLYDPDMGIDLRLSCSAAGQAWLMTLPEDLAIEYVTHQGMGQPRHYGPQAPTSFKALLKQLDEHRKRGFSLIEEGYAPGMSSMAAPVQRKGEPATGVIVIAGPSLRLTAKRMQQFGPALLAAAQELALTGNASALLKSANVGTWGNAPDEAPRVLTRRNR